MQDQFDYLQSDQRQRNYVFERKITQLEDMQRNMQVQIEKPFQLIAPLEKQLDLAHERWSNKQVELE
jgi:hypothetical protein